MVVSPSYPESLQLVLYPDPVLRQPCRPVTVFDDALQGFCHRMFEAMREWQGVGLAAPQVGVSSAIFVTNHRGWSEDVVPELRVWINPQIAASDGEHAFEEGCLSLPGIYGKVTRPARVTVTAQDSTGADFVARFDAEADDFLGIVVQHELDHLLGKLHIDYFDIPSLELSRRKLRDMEKRYRKQTGQKGAVLRR